MSITAQIPSSKIPQSAVLYKYWPLLNFVHRKAKQKHSHEKTTTNPTSFIDPYYSV